MFWKNPSWLLRKADLITGSGRYRAPEWIRPMAWRSSARRGCRKYNCRTFCLQWLIGMSPFLKRYIWRGFLVCEHNPLGRYVYCSYLLRRSSHWIFCFSWLDISDYQKWLYLEDSLLGTLKTKNKAVRKQIESNPNRLPFKNQRIWIE